MAGGLTIVAGVFVTSVAVMQLQRGIRGSNDCSSSFDSLSHHDEFFSSIIQVGGAHNFFVQGDRCSGFSSSEPLLLTPKFVGSRYF